MRKVLLLTIIVLLISPPTFHLDGVAQDSAASTSPPSVTETTSGAQAGSPDVGPQSQAALEVQRRLEGDFDAEKIVAANSWVASTGVADWLGPLAPIAISPFFGIACLSALSLWGPSWVSDSSLLSSAGPLQHEWLFGIFALMALLTSVPRFTKVSKPFAQAVDQLETYSVIVILLVIKLVATMESPDTEPVDFVQLGVISFTFDTLLAIAMVINIVVINSVKFFFEFLVWLTPVPLLDAVFEICNKTLCAALMAVYAISPTLATIINLCVLVLAAIIFRWISRRIRFYRTIILDPLLARVWGSYAQPKHQELIVFPKGAIGPFKPKSRLKLRKNNDGELMLHEGSWWRPAKSHSLTQHEEARIRRGWIMNAVCVKQSGCDCELNFSRRYNAETLESLAGQLGLEMAAEEAEAGETKRHDRLASEFA